MGLSIKFSCLSNCSGQMICARTSPQVHKSLTHRLLENTCTPLTCSKSGVGLRLPLRFLISRFISVCPSCRIVPSEISDESTPDPATRGDLQLHMSWRPDLHLQTFAKMGLDVIDEITHVLRIRHIVASDPKDSTAAKGKKRLTGFVRVGSRCIHLCLF